MRSGYRVGFSPPTAPALMRHEQRPIARLKQIPRRPTQHELGDPRMTPCPHHDEIGRLRARRFEQRRTAFLRGRLERTEFGVDVMPCKPRAKIELRQIAQSEWILDRL